MDQIDLQALFTGQATPWRSFVDLSAPIVLATVRRVFAKYGRMGSPDEHEDISQEVFLKLSRGDFRLLRQFDPAKAKLSTYLGVIARSTAIDFLRRAKPQAEDIDDLADKIPAPASAFDGGGDPSIGTGRTSAGSLLDAMPASLLSDKQRLILGLLFDHDLDPEDVAEKLGVETQTIRSAKHKALTKIRAHMNSLPQAQRPL